MSKKINYWECPYAMDADEAETTFSDNYPCNNPANFDKDCPLRNKQPGQIDECQLLNK